MTWQPISTAPKDGTVVVVGKLRNGGLFPSYPVEAKRVGDRWTMRVNGRWVSFDPQPTHWRPEPEAPALSAKGGS